MYAQLLFPFSYGEYYTVRVPPGCVFLHSTGMPCDHGLDFDISLLRENSTNTKNRKTSPPYLVLFSKDGHN